MALKTFVKISEVNNLSDARYCAGMGVDLMGFVTDPSHHSFLSPESFKEISEWLAGVEFVAELSENTVGDSKSIVEHYDVQYLQFEQIEYLNELVATDRSLIFKIDLAELNDENELEALCNATMGKVSYVLLESSTEVDDKFKAKSMEIAENHKILLGFGVEADNVLDLIDSSSISGIALKGGDEIKPGYKDFDALADILEAIEVEDY
jgi:phosphoribosylanthranilate isomerase